jgi:DNA-binding NarL/FixJ family response regulator
MLTSSGNATVLIVDPLPLRNLGLVGIVSRLSIEGGVAFAMADDLDKWIQADGQCRVIIYNVGGASVTDRTHLKRIRMLQKRMADVPLVIFSYNNSRKEVLSAMRAGVQGFLYAGTEIDLARQALSLVCEGGSDYSVAAQNRRNISVSCSTIMDDDQGKGVGSPITAIGVENPPVARSANDGLTRRQNAVLQGLSRGESNKTIARRLGIREGTIKVHVRQIMRKLGVVNRTQVAIACAGSIGARPAVGLPLRSSSDSPTK